MAGTVPTLAQLLAAPAGPMQQPLHGLRVRVDSIRTGATDPQNHSDASKGDAPRIHCPAARMVRVVVERIVA